MQKVSTPTYVNRSESPKSNPGFNLKRARYFDMPLVTNFINSSAKWYEPFVAEKDMSEHRPDQHWVEKNYFRREFYIGYSGNQPVGTISYQNLGNYAYLGYIYLDVDQVGKGYGKRLMDHAKEIAVKKGKKGMVLIAHPEAKWATKAYVKYGFKKIAAKKDEVLAWEDGALKSYYEEGFELYEYSL